MNRRKFFNFLGSAVIGTVIALKLPDAIAPLNNLIRERGISFQALYEAYQDCVNKIGEPTSIVISKKNYERIHQMFEPQYRFDNAEAQHLVFQNAIIQSIDSVAVEEDEFIVFAGKYRNHAKKYSFV